MLHSIIFTTAASLLHKLLLNGFQAEHTFINDLFTTIWFGYNDLYPVDGNIKSRWQKCIKCNDQIRSTTKQT